ncbi:MAG: hypothetical protein AAF740_01975, partial [Bacteroidota bacterium]
MWLFWVFPLLGYAQTPANTADSTVLVQLYESLNGDQWFTNTNWLSAEPLTRWEGVTLDTNGYVIHIRLANNNLSGQLPSAVGDLDSLILFDLSRNRLSQQPPSSLFSLDKLEEIYLNDNLLTGELPTSIVAADSLRICSVSNNNLTGVPTFVNSDTLSRAELLDVSGNRLTFNELRFSTPFSAYRYSPQQDVEEPETITRVVGGNAILEVVFDETGTLYQWFKDENLITGATNPSLRLSNLQLSDAGVYVCQMTHPDVANLTLSRSPITLRIDQSAERQQDSLALVAIYQENNGVNWSSQTNWLSPNIPIDQWEGVTVTNQRVTNLRLSGNSLKGTLSTKIGDLTALETLIASNCDLSALPNKLFTLPELIQLNVSNNNLQDFNQFTSSVLPNLDILQIQTNQISSIRNFTGHPTLRAVNIQNNLLDFNQIAKNLDRFEIYAYSPQLPFGMEQEFFTREGGTVQLDAIFTNTSYDYQWFFEGDSIREENTPTLTLNNLQASQAGAYTCRFTSDNIPNLILEQVEVRIEINTAAEIQQDSLALVTFYQTMNGENWANQTNWLSNRPINEWFGVTTEAGRVVSLDLPANRLDGELSSTVGQWEKLETINLSDNILRGFLPQEIGNWERIIEINLADSRDPNNDGDQTAGLRGEIPISIRQLDRLQTLTIQNARLSSIARLQGLPALHTLDLSGNNLGADVSLTGLQSLDALKDVDLSNNTLEQTADLSFLQRLDLSGNAFTFEALEPNRNIPDFTYAPQADLAPRQVFNQKPDESITFSAQAGGTQNEYRWVKDGQALSETLANLSFTDLQKSDQGTYRGFVTNDLLPGLTLQTGEFVLFVVSEEDLTKEREALRALYDATDGPNWRVARFWFTGSSDDLEEWYGISLNAAGQVQELNLSNNRLRGALPEALRDLKGLEILRVDRNTITGIATNGLREIPTLRELYLDDCDLTDLPDLTGFPA